MEWFYFNQGEQEELSDMVTYEQSSEGSDGVICIYVWGKKNIQTENTVIVKDFSIPRKANIHAYIYMLIYIFCFLNAKPRHLNRGYV